MSEPAPGFQKHPDYQVQINPTEEHIVVRANGVVLADTNRALQVIETRHHPVWYLPVADVNTALLTATDHSTYCPFKGHASYWSIAAGGTTFADTVWGYQNPYAECEPLRDHVAFYTDRVQLEVAGRAQPERAPGWSD